MSGFEIVGVILATPAIIESVYKAWDHIQERKANNEKLLKLARDLKSFGISYSRFQLTKDIERAQILFKDRSATKEDKLRVKQCFEGIHSQLDRIKELVDVVQEDHGMLDFKNRSKRSDAVRELKDTLESSKSSLREFHQLVTSLSDIAKSESPFYLDDKDFVVVGKVEERTKVNSLTFIAEGSVAVPDASPEGGDFLFETKPYLATQPINSAHKDLRALCQRLSTAQSESGVLPLVGFRDSPGEDTHQLVFRQVPKTISMQSLEDFYTKTTSKPSLNTRVDFCQQLAEALLETHTIGLVHKHIRPDNILLVELPPAIAGEVNRYDIYLSGWQYARHIDGEATLKVGEASWQKAIYQHPARQRPKADREYFISDDIYSLGVCMLEILSWDPLVRTGNTSMSPGYQQVFNELKFDANIPAGSKNDVLWLTKVPAQVKQVLVKMAETTIPPAAGNKVADLVKDCLEDVGTAEGKDRKEVAKEFVNTILRDIRSVASIL